MPRLNLLKGKKNFKNALCLSVNVFSTKVLIGDTVLMWDGTAILRGRPSHAGQR